MNKKSGEAGSPVEPIAPITPHEADVADPGSVSEMKAEQRQTQSGKYGSTKAKPFKPPLADDGGATAGSTSEESENEKNKASWIEIELIGEDDEPIPGEKYRITLPDDTVDEGTLDHNGWARVAGFENGTCQVSFPELDPEAWIFLRSAGAKQVNA